MNRSPSRENLIILIVELAHLVCLKLLEFNMRYHNILQTHSYSDDFIINLQDTLVTG